MSKGRHAKESGAWKKVTLVAGVATTGAIPLSVVSAPTAQAAPISAWDKIAECESNGRWNLPYGHASSTGGLQIQQPTWNDYGGQKYAPQPYQATKQEQIIVAEKILAGQGPGAWTCNAMTGYPLSSSGPNSTYHKGGTNPYPGGGTTAPANTPSTGGTYTVQAGDSLFLIAKAKLGDGQKWPSIYKINKQVIGPDPDMILPGQKLKMPGGSSTPPATGGVTKGYVTPVKAKISQHYGGHASASYELGYHTGTDFAAATGTPTVAATDGVVVASDTSYPYGINVQMKTNDGHYLLYAHLSSKSVTPGQAVKAGQQVGLIGSTPGGMGPHLHFEVRKTPTFGAGNFLDAVPWLRSHGVTL